MWVIPLLLAAASSCDAGTLGIVRMNEKQDPKLYVTRRLTPNEPVYLQYPDKSGATRCCVRLSGRDFNLSDSDPAASEVLTGKPVHSYSLKKGSRPIVLAPFLGMAAVGRGMKVEQGPADLLILSGPDGVLIGRSCTSQEGMHVTGEAKAKIVSEIYFSVGYEIEQPAHSRDPDDLRRQ